jgi:hypothetical protein
VTLRIQIDIEPVWTVVRRIREQVAQALAAYPENVRSATVMTASELVENAVKYGESVPNAATISFSLIASPDSLRVEVTNGSKNTDSVARLRERIAAIVAAPDKTALYMDRLEHLLSTPSESGQLGLYRIAFEGAYELSCTYEESVVTVNAVRRLS